MTHSAPNIARATSRRTALCSLLLISRRLFVRLYDLETSASVCSLSTADCAGECEVRYSLSALRTTITCGVRHCTNSRG
ncbi:hypothetical protein OH76DRAFT_1238361 [Lentinus brumalis]|uniref:Uncharacterized protein n=1 Tax=Lentinus brumalis TaxID=2498619 RepID=A0A371CS32_9APHY|nr:hypothetical protein OH76DRAFT_1238361 [Polyporus brumalis]